MEIPSKLQKEINEYCKANNIDDVNTFMLKILIQGFNIEKYGLKPNSIKNEPKYVPLQSPTPVEKPKTKRVTKKTVKEEPIEQKKDLYDED